MIYSREQLKGNGPLMPTETRALRNDLRAVGKKVLAPISREELEHDWLTHVAKRIDPMRKAQRVDLAEDDMMGTGGESSSALADAPPSNSLALPLPTATAPLPIATIDNPPAIDVCAICFTGANAKDARIMELEDEASMAADELGCMRAHMTTQAAQMVELNTSNELAASTNRGLLAANKAVLTKNAALIAEGATFKQAAAHFKTKQEEALATAALRQVELKDMELENKWLRYKLYGGQDYVAYVYKLPVMKYHEPTRKALLELGATHPSDCWHIKPGTYLKPFIKWMPVSDIQ